MNVEQLGSGKSYVLYAVVENGKCLVKEFIDSLTPANQGQIISLINRILENGPPRNEEKFRHLGDKIYELKTRSGVRILVFFGGRKSLVLTHGFFKVASKKLQREKDKAVAWYKEYHNIT